MITQGWEYLKSFHGSKSEKIFVLYYVGNCCFKILLSRCSVDPQIQSNFLNNIALHRPLTTSNIIHFKVNLTQSYYQANHLVISFVV